MSMHDSQFFACAVQNTCRREPVAQLGVIEPPPKNSLQELKPIFNSPGDENLVLNTMPLVHRPGQMRHRIPISDRGLGSGSGKDLDSGLDMGMDWIWAWAQSSGQDLGCGLDISSSSRQDFGSGFDHGYWLEL